MQETIKQKVKISRPNLNSNSYLADQFKTTVTGLYTTSVEC